MKKLLPLLLLLLLIFSGCGPEPGWHTQEAGTCYIDPQGQPLTGLQEIDGHTYFFGPDGYLRTGWQEGRHFGPDGTMSTGWLEDDGRLRYLLPDGTPAMGWVDGHCFAADGTPLTGWQQSEAGPLWLDATGAVTTGWVEDGGLWYLDADGHPVTGWQHIDEKTYYFPPGSPAHTGWLSEGEYRYYFLPDGSMAASPTQIDGRTHYFTPQGIHVTLVNAANPIPEGYVPQELVPYLEVYELTPLCLSHLDQMLSDCREAGNPIYVNSAYRSPEKQQSILTGQTIYYMTDWHLSYEDATARALLTVAAPGTSEHHLGLAVDVDGELGLAWLREHCWEYGFILRYPEDKTEITGILYEPWHFRYVGTGVSLPMKDSGLCLEEFLGAT